MISFSIPNIANLFVSLKDFIKELFLLFLVRLLLKEDITLTLLLTSISSLLIFFLISQKENTLIPLFVPKYVMKLDYNTFKVHTK